jgi:hypothetical protein
MEKVIRDGKVAVLYSPGYGAGWYSWHGILDAIFHPKLVELVENGRRSEITQEWITENLNLEHIYTGGAIGLEIAWIPEGTRFQITEYDGSESVILEEDLNLITA